MTRAKSYEGPRFEVPQERAEAVRGLSWRLALKAIHEADQTPRLFLPVFRPKQLPDQPNERRRSNA